MYSKALEFSAFFILTSSISNCYSFFNIGICKVLSEVFSKQKTLAPWIGAFDVAESHETGMNCFLALTQNMNNPGVLVNEVFMSSTGRPYFFREFDEDDILKSYFDWVRRHISFSATVIIAMDSIHRNIDMTNALLGAKLLRPHIDRVIQIVFESEYSKTVEDYFDRFRLIHVYGIGDTELRSGWSVRFSPSQLCSTRLLNGKEVRVLATKTPERIKMDFSPSGQLLNAHGPYYQMLQWSSVKFNFTLYLQHGSSGGSAGMKLENGTWVGALGDVFRNEATLAVHVGASALRHCIADFTSVTDLISRVFYTRMPPRRLPSWRALYRPYTSSVWMLIGLTLGIVIALGYSFSKVHNSEDFTEFCTRLLKIVVDQASTTMIQVKGFRLRVLLVCWTSFCFLMGIGYRSKLVSFLSTVEVGDDLGPKTHRDLANSQYKLYFRTYGGTALATMTTSKNPTHIKISQRMTILNDSPECLWKVMTHETAACLDYNIAFEHAEAGNISNSKRSAVKLFKKSEDTDFSFFLTWCFRKGSPILPEFQFIVEQALASGLFFHWLELHQIKIEREGIQWRQKENSSSLEIAMKDLTGDFARGYLSLGSLYGVNVLGACGCILALFVFLLENSNLFFKFMETHS